MTAELTVRPIGHVVGMIGFAQLLPLLVGALWGGTLADAWDRKRVLTLTQVAMAAAVGGLAVNAALDHPQVWVLFVCTAASAGFQGMDWPARRAALPMLVADDDVDAAVALQTTTMGLAMVVGPAMAGVLIAAFGLSTVYLIDVASYGVSLVVVLLLPHLVPSGGGTPMGFRSMTEGFRHLKSERPYISTGEGLASSACCMPPPAPVHWPDRCSPAGAATSATRAVPSPSAW